MSAFQGFDGEVASYMAEMRSVMAEVQQVQAGLTQHAQVAQKRVTKSTGAHQQFAQKWQLRLQAEAVKVDEYDRAFDISSSNINF